MTSGWDLVHACFPWFAVVALIVLLVAMTPTKKKRVVGLKRELIRLNDQIILIYIRDCDKTARELMYEKLYPLARKRQRTLTDLYAVEASDE